jgi:hypothetical protein
MSSRRVLTRISDKPKLAKIVRHAQAKRDYFKEQHARLEAMHLELNELMRDYLKDYHQDVIAELIALGVLDEEAADTIEYFVDPETDSIYVEDVADAYARAVVDRIKSLIKKE